MLAKLIHSWITVVCKYSQGTSLALEEKISEVLLVSAHVWSAPSSDCWAACSGASSPSQLSRQSPGSTRKPRALQQLVPATGTQKSVMLAGSITELWISAAYCIYQKNHSVSSSASLVLCFLSGCLRVVLSKVCDISHLKKYGSWEIAEVDHFECYCWTDLI